jgi:hypothetical protein
MNAPELLKQEMQMYRQSQRDVLAYGYEPGTKEFNDAMKVAIDFYRKFGMEVCVK